MDKEYDVIVVGSGIGGSTVAREMARKGKKVLMLERGGRMDWLGNTLTVAMVLQYFGLVRSKEGCVITFGDNYGGLSVLTAGCAVPPPKSIFDPLGIDLSRESEEAKKDMKVQILPDELVGKANLRLVEAANDAGYHWAKLEKFIDATKCRENCSLCMLGCPHDAKFTAREYGDEAVRNGADLKLHTKVTGIMKSNGKAIGVEARRFGSKVNYYGKTTVLATGIGNVDLLRKAGISEAGKGFACDWLQFVGGIIPGMNTSHANPMSVGTLEHYESDGMAIIPVFPNWSQFLVMCGLMGPQYVPKFANFWRYSGIMVKIQDEVAGAIYKGVSFSKPVTDPDRKRLNKGVDIIKKVLKKAGAKDEDVFVMRPNGAHPSASCRIGEVVDKNLQTRIDNLYCCDASVFPKALGLPVVWTVTALGKRLSKHLDGQLGGKK